MAPLLQPAECCILCVDPRKQHVSIYNQERQHELIQCFILLENAASATAVPRHYALQRAKSDPSDWLALPCDTVRPRIYTLSESGSSWSSSGIAAALIAENRACLLLCGFWLETSVSFIALQALSAGFDVFVLMDATPSRAEVARGPSSDRLLQAGVVPLTTHQLIAEWHEQSADLNVRLELSRLIPSS